MAAVIQPREGSNLTAAEVQTHCKNHISSYKKPRYVVFMDDMKRDSAGKVRKQGIVAYFDERKEQAAPRHHEKLRSDPDIHLIQVPYSGGTPIGYTNAYLIATDERNLLVDTGVSTRRRTRCCARRCRICALTWRAPMCSPRTSTSIIWV